MMQVRFFLCILGLLSICPQLLGNEVVASRSKLGTYNINTDVFLAANRYAYYDGQLAIDFSLCKRADVNSLCGVLIQANAEDHASAMLIVDWDAPRDTIVLISIVAGRVNKHLLTVTKEFGESQPFDMSITIDFDFDVTVIRTNGGALTLHNLGFASDKGYAFSLLPRLSVRPDPNIPPVLQMTDLSVATTTISPKKSAWYWISGIIVADIVAFMVVMLRRRRKRLRPRHAPQPSAVFVPEHALRSGSILLFGGLYIYDAEGKDITKLFSPILRELLSLLVVHSTGRGISSDMLSEVLWADKTTESARNNRAVYLGKLRTLLDKVGQYELSNESGYWKLIPHGIFIDYHHFAAMDWPQFPTHDQITRLMNLVHAGNLIPTSDYRWLDSYKARVADVVIEKLREYFIVIESQKMPDFVIAMTDTMLCFENMNEQALYMKCKTYQESGRHSSAKKAYDLFCEEYKEVYGKVFPYTLAELLEKNEW